MTPPYWLDSNILIEAANGPYSFSRAPTYWTALDKALNDGVVCTSAMVYRELVPFGDELSNWVKNRKQNGLFIEPNADVQTSFNVVADYVMSCGRYDFANVNDFLSGADPWMIAHLRVTGGSLVTNETALRPAAKKIRIPDVCQQFATRCITGYEMLDELEIVR